MSIQTLTHAEVLRQFSISPAGLTTSEAAKLLQEYGPNEIAEARRTPLYLRFLAQLTHFLAVLLWVAAALCFLSEYLRPGEGLLSLGIAILGVILINAVFTFIQEYRAERAVAALKALLPFDVRVRRDGREQTIAAREVVPGDLVLLAEGDKTPADARLIAVNRLKVNNAPLTGESDPKPRSAEPFRGHYLESPNLVFAGTLVVSGNGEAVALATGAATEFGKIAHLTGGVEEGLSPLQQEIVRASRVLAAIAIVLGLLFFGLGFGIGRSFWHNFLFAIGIIIACVPEGLLPTVTLSLAMGSQRMAGKKALIKNLNSVETLGSVTVICSDKTGTLTQNLMEVKSLWTPGVPAGTGEAAAVMLMKIACLCNNAVLAEDGFRGDPTETALLKAARDRLGEVTAARLAELPFDAERKRMSTVNRLEGKTLLLTKGALETLLPLCEKIFLGEADEPLGDSRREAVMAAYHRMVDGGLRVLAFAYRSLADGEAQGEVAFPDLEAQESSLTLVGLIGLEDPVRPEVERAVATCRQAGIRVIMITGDAGRTALALARQIGIAEGNARVVEGSEIERLPDRRLREVLKEAGVIFARMTPRHKMRLVSILKEEGERVAVTGDGVNDAPALKRADIGIAMGLIGTDVAREAADMVLLDDNFATIVNAIEEGRAVFQNIQKFISYILASNIPEIVPYLAYVLLGIPLPLTILQILAVDLGTDLFPALALGAEKPSPEVMQQPPRPPGERLLNWNILTRAYLFLGPIEAAAGLFGYFYVLYAGGWQWGQMLDAAAPLYLQATTACWGAIVVTQIANLFACRSFRESVFSLGLFSNPMVLWGIALEIIIAAFFIYHPLGNRILGTAPLPAVVWVMLAPFGIMLLFLEEMRKWSVRRRLKISRAGPG